VIPVKKPDSAAPAAIRTVVIAVADPEESRELCGILAFPDLQVHAVETAAQFRGLLENTIPDLAILDYSLPDGPGFGLCRELREDARTRRLSVVILLPPQGTTLEECFISGINDFLGRPIDAGEVVRKVDRLTRVPDRKRLNTLALVKPDGSEATLLGRAVNASPSGILLELDAGLAIGTVCEVRFNLPGESEPVRARGVVRRRAREAGLVQTGFGIEFATLGPDDRGRLHRFFGESRESGGTP